MTIVANLVKQVVFIAVNRAYRRRAWEDHFRSPFTCNSLCNNDLHSTVHCQEAKVSGQRSGAQGLLFHDIFTHAFLGYCSAGFLSDDILSVICLCLLDYYVFLMPWNVCPHTTSTTSKIASYSLQADRSRRGSPMFHFRWTSVEWWRHLVCAMGNGCFKEGFLYDLCMVCEHSRALYFGGFVSCRSRAQKNLHEHGRVYLTRQL